MIERCFAGLRGGGLRDGDRHDKVGLPVLKGVEAGQRIEDFEGEDGRG